MGLKFAIVNLPSIDTSDPNNKDVASRTLTVKVDGNEVASLDVPGQDAVAQIDNDAFVGNAGQTVEASLVYADGQTPPNVGKPRVETVTLTDNIAPDQPDDFGVKAVGQV